MVFSLHVQQWRSSYEFQSWQDAEGIGAPRGAAETQPRGQACGVVPRPRRARPGAGGPGCAVGTRARRKLPSIPDIRVPFSLGTKEAPVIGVLEPPGWLAPGKLVGPPPGVWVEVSRGSLGDQRASVVRKQENRTD